MKADRVLAVDIGTSSARALVFDGSGAAVAGQAARAAVPLRTEPPGAAEVDADALVDRVAACVDLALARAGDEARRIAAVGVCTFWHSMLGVDGAGRPITPVYTWADTRPAEAARALARERDEASLHARTGCAIHPSYWPARLRWLQDRAPALWRAAALWLSPGDYVLGRFFGGPACTVSMASGTGLLDQDRCDWDDDALSAAGLSRSRLAPLVDTDAPAHGLRPEWASRWPVLADVPWVRAVGDGAASNLGSGCASDRRVAINLGTSGAIRVLWAAERFGIPPDLWCYRLDRRRRLAGGAFSDGGSVHAWARQALALPDEAAVEEVLAGREPDCHGLTFLPFLGGERSIGWRPDARATLHGLSTATGPLDIVQALMEGVALRFALVAGALAREFPAAREVVASGGALAASRVWAHMLADALGRPVLLSAEAEASSRGAALLALRAAGLIADEAGATRPPTVVVEPDPRRHAVLAAALERQEALYRALGAGGVP